jgi:hypothetical protein
LATTCDKNEQQQDANSNAELLKKWGKKFWKTFEENIRRARKRSTKAKLVMDDDDNDDDDDDIIIQGRKICRDKVHHTNCFDFRARRKNNIQTQVRM